MDHPRDEITKVLDANGLTKSWLAGQIGEDRQNVINWLKGKYHPLDPAVWDRMLEKLAPFRGTGEATSNAKILREPKRLIEGFRQRVAIRSWSGAMAAMFSDDDAELIQDEANYEIPAAFLVGGFHNADHHDIIRIVGDSMLPVVEHNDRVVVFRTEELPKNAIVFASDSEGRHFLKVLVKPSTGRFQLRSINPDGKHFEDIEGWKIHGYAVAILKDRRNVPPLSPSVVWEEGSPLTLNISA